MRIYTVAGVAPEVQAYGMAKYSRSAQAMSDSLKDVSQQKAAEFLESFYFKYGHKSIADMAHVPMAIEDISTLAAMIILDEPIWDGQERSTRYQDFKKSGYYVPSGATASFVETVDQMFAEYRSLSERLYHALMEQYPRPEQIGADEYKRTMRARAFDVARYWLPLATKTSLGQITSARVLERQISRLMGSELAELREIAAGMRSAAVEQPAFTLNDDTPEPLLPTLAKYTAASEYASNSQMRLRTLASEVLSGGREGLMLKPRTGVDLHLPTDPVIHAITTLFYSATNLPYAMIEDEVRELSEKEQTGILEEIFQGRGRHDEWLRQLQAGPLVFDITMDIGSFRDLNRHRRSPKILQPLTHKMGYEIPAPLAELGLAAGYDERMRSHYAAVKDLSQWNALEANYALPFAARCRSLFQMDIAQAAYITELRTGSAGHFSYREIAYQMYEQMQAKLPAFAKFIRVTNPREVYDPFKR